MRACISVWLRFRVLLQPAAAMSTTPATAVSSAAIRFVHPDPVVISHLAFLILVLCRPRFMPAGPAPITHTASGMCHGSMGDCPPAWRYAQK